MKEIESLNGDGNKVWFIRGNDGDICITFSVPSKKVFLEYEIKGMYTEFPEGMPEVYLDEKSNQGWGISLPETSSEPEKNSGI